ncbi:sterol-binding protein [uncultured Jatrophihabitans sp.]|uniref:sterol-binding protein n=1 Tax=uncultured Jatrophihabitans sp. TaxID=1610747 RepID=UPI0035CC68D7
MASLQECEQALHVLADRLAATDPARRTAGFDRTLSCTIRDLHVVFGGRLHDGLLLDIARVDAATGQITLDLTGDDLLALVDGSLNLASAWAGGRVKVSAGVRDLMKLRSIF